MNIYKTNVKLLIRSIVKHLRMISHHLKKDVRICISAQKFEYYSMYIGPKLVTLLATICLEVLCILGENT